MAQQDYEDTDILLLEGVAAGYNTNKLLAIKFKHELEATAAIEGKTLEAFIRGRLQVLRLRREVRYSSHLVQWSIVDQVALKTKTIGASTWQRPKR